MNIKRISEERN